MLFQKPLSGLSLIGCISLFLINQFLFGQDIQPSALRQIESLNAEKESRTLVQKKLDSQLWYALKMARGQAITPLVKTLDVSLEKNAAGNVQIELSANVSKSLLADLDKLGMQVTFSSERFRSISGFAPLLVVEKIAALDGVLAVKKWWKPMNNSRVPTAGIKEKPESVRQDKVKTIGESIREALSPEIAGINSITAGAVTSEADVTHKAALARNVFNVNGSGVKIGVISDSYNAKALAASDVTAGELPGVGNPNGYTTPVTVLSDYATGTDEGRAMMQLVHDIAPGAQLYFATAFISKAGFAQAILDLRAAGCDIIVDDVSYFDEAVFQDDKIAQAVNSVTASGALYFSSAGNSGNKNDNTAGVWEGDFADGGTNALIVTGGSLHNFGINSYNILTGLGSSIWFKWSDSYGLSGNDYDLYTINAAGTAVLGASTGIQDGNDDAWEALGNPAVNSRVVIFKKSSASIRALHLNTMRGRLSVSTSGIVYGHNAGKNTISVAATPAPAAYPNFFNASNAVETFSSDGLRKIFYNPDSTAITPGNFLFGSNGGTTLQKPDLTAADGTNTSVAGFIPFYGTSAAAPHAAAIAALVKSKMPGLNAAQIKSALNASAIDIETPGIDRDAGAGIIMAYEAIAAAGATPSSTMLSMGSAILSEGSFGNGNGTADPGESAALVIPLINLTSAGATAVSAVLSTSTPDISIYKNTISYPDILGLATISNSASPFLIAIPSSLACGTSIFFNLVITYTGGFTATQTFTLSQKVGNLPYTVISGILGNTPPSIAGMVSSAGSQTGRIARNLPGSSCALSQPAPGLTVSTGARSYHAYQFTNSASSSQCVTVNFSSASGSLLYTAAYDNSGYLPSSPNSNFLADPGTSGTNISYSFNVASGQNFTVVVHEVDVAGAAGAAYTLNVDLAVCQAAPVCQALTISPANLSANCASVGNPFSQTFTSAGGSGAVQYSITAGALPAGLSLSGNQLSGTPQTAGANSFTITATDLVCGTSVSTSYSLTVNPQISISAVSSSACGGSALTVSALGGAGNALTFGGTRRVINSAFNTSPSVFPVLTASAWVNRTGAVPVYAAIVSNDDAPGFDRALIVYKDSTYHIFAGRDIATGIPSSLNKWEFMSVIWSASSVTLFKNGVQVFTTTGETISSSVSGTAIGSAVGTSSLPFPGTIDQVSIWSTTRSAAQLQSEMSYLPSGTQTGLELLYKFDEGSGTTTADLSGKGRTGTLGGTLGSYPVWGSSNAPTGFASYLWSPGGETSSVISVNPSTTTNYSVQVSNANGCGGISAITTVNVVQISGGLSSICVGENTAWNGNGTAVSWTSSNPAVATVSPSGLITGVSAGTANITYSNSTGCSAIRQVTVNALPVTPVISGRLSFCSGSSTTLDAGAGYSSYLWSNGETTQSIETFIPGTFSVTVTNANGCSAQSAASEVVEKYPSVSVQEATACLSYLWNNITYTNSGTYSYQTTNAAGCDSTAMLVLTVLKLPAITPYFTGPTGVCRSKTGIVYSIPASAGATSYTWILPAGLTGSSTTNSITVASSSTFAGGNIQVKANNSCGSTPFIQLSVVAATALPAAPAAITGVNTICSGSYEAYECSNVAGATYLWTIPANATFIGGQGTSSVTILFDAAYNTGSISVKSTNCFGTSTAARSLTVTKKAVPATPGVITGTNGFCVPSTQTYSIAAVTNATDYTWTAPANASIVSQSGTSVTVAFGEAYTIGNLSVTASNCSGTSAFRILALTKKALPGTPGVITGITTGACSAERRTYTIVALANTDSYQWTAPANASIYSGQGSTSVVVEFAAGFTTGSLSVKGVNCSGTSVTARTLALSNVTAAPTVLTGPNTAVCPGSTQTYSTTAVANGTTYTWAVPSGAIINSGQGSTSISVTFPSPFTSGAVSVKSGTACYSSAAKALTVYSVPVAPVSITGNALGVCGGSTQTYTCPISTTGAISYNWTVPAGATINSGQGGNSISVTLPTIFATGNVTVTSSNSCGTSTVRTLAIRSTLTTPGVISGQSTNLCGGGRYTYTIVAVAGASSYNWTIPAACTMVENLGTSITLDVPATGFTSGTLSVSAQNTCGTGALRSLTLSALPATPASVSGPASVCPSATGIVYSTPVVSGVTNYTWTVPTGASITAGQNTSSITANWGTVVGSVTVKAGNACGTNATAKALAVTLSVACREAVSEEVETINLYPNPANQMAKLNFSSAKESSYTVRIINSMGQSVYSSEGNASEGANIIDLNLENLSSGFFIVQLVQDGSRQQLSLVKK